MSNESPWVDARKYREAKKAALVKRVRESEKEELAARVAEQDRLNAKIRQVRSEYLVADAIEQKVLDPCDCCAVLTASVNVGEDCVLTVAYPNPNLVKEPVILASGTLSAGSPLLRFDTVYEDDEMKALLASGIVEGDISVEHGIRENQKTALKKRVDEALSD